MEAQIRTLGRHEQGSAFTCKAEFHSTHLALGITGPVIGGIAPK